MSFAAFFHLSVLNSSTNRYSHNNLHPPPPPTGFARIRIARQPDRGRRRAAQENAERTAVDRQRTSAGRRRLQEDAGTVVLPAAATPASVFFGSDALMYSNQDTLNK